MRSFVRAALIGAALLTATGAGSASAAPLCAGTTTTWVVCVDPSGPPYYQDCIYVGIPPCTPVVVPGPDGEVCGGNVGTATCKQFVDPVLCPILGTFGHGDDFLRDCPPYHS